ncbi:MAG TPA: ABC transporter substrate-binding protein, partial [Thermoanaerobaculia bacterium]|nr:ABC transporter substrate-binding protein [Thermoanaerobaculia bacterium]
MNDRSWTRRAFLEGALGTGALALLGGTPSLLAAATSPISSPARKLRVGLLLPGPGPLAADGDALGLGARLAAEEARRTAELVGGSFELLEATAADPRAAAREAARLAEREKVFALVGGLDQRTRESVSEVALRSRVLFLTTRAPGAALYAEPVRDPQFHLTASHHDLCRALAQYLVTEAKLASWFLVGLTGEEGRYLTGTARQALLQNGGLIAGTATVEPGATSFAPLLAQLAQARPQLVFLSLGEPTLSRLLAALDASKGASAPLSALPVAGPYPPFSGDRLTAASPRRAIWPALWHPALVSGGAVQLNQRFQARWNRPMGPLAWMAWAAVKAATELALRAPAGPGLAAGLARFQFDGHKGFPLHFDSNHFLRQPIYLVGRKPGEIS